MNEQLDKNLNNEAPASADSFAQKQNEPHPDFQRTGVISMVLGIAAVTIAIVFFGALGLDLILAIISLIFAKKNKKVSPDGRTNTMALVGTICSWVAIVIFSIWLAGTLLILALWILYVLFAVIISLLAVLPAVFAQSLAIMPVALLLL